LGVTHYASTFHVPCARKSLAWLSSRPYAAAVASVDPDDDNITRHVVWHYRYDSDRNERRNVVVAAFDDWDEMVADCRRRADELRARRKSGGDVDPAERISGTTHERGHRARWANGHMVHRAIRHGAHVPNIEELDLPFPVITATLRE
jgi:hypothetical protein